MSRALVFLLLTLTFGGCGGWQRAAEDRGERASFAVIAGMVSAEDASGAPLVVALLRAPEREGCPFHTVDRAQVFGRRGRYEIVAPPGRYRLVAFEDESRDIEYSEGERITSFDSFRDIDLGPGVHASLDLTVTSHPASRPPTFTAAMSPDRAVSAGEVRALEDARFGPEVARTGIWEPLRFMREAGAGIFFLEPYDPARTPVLLVHGMGGYPQEFAALVSRIDRREHQIWVAHYPSGWDLDAIASALHRALNEAQSTHRFEGLCVVAHSMGGVVSRRVLALHARQREDPSRSFVRGFVTIASPLDGHPGAASGVALSPVVVDSWRSLVPTSVFLRGLYEVPLDRDTRYALFFTYVPGASDDGVVPLASQLRREAQDEAHFMRGFDETHTGVLRAPRALDAITRELAQCRGASQAR